MGLTSGRTEAFAALLTYDECLRSLVGVNSSLDKAQGTHDNISRFNQRLGSIDALYEHHKALQDQQYLAMSSSASKGKSTIIPQGCIRNGSSIEVVESQETNQIIKSMQEERPTSIRRGLRLLSSDNLYLDCRVIGEVSFSGSE
jgi:hypothetical protein